MKNSFTIPFLHSFLSEGFAHKICESDADWFRHPFTNRSWTNYTTCIDVQDFEVSNNEIYVGINSIDYVLLLLLVRSISS